MEISKFERARILGVRALQISMNAPIFIPTNGESDPLILAINEYNAGKTPIVIKRVFPDGTSEEINVNTKDKVQKRPLFLGSENEKT